jgi:CRISPR system Cascade subunit CasD
VTDFLRFTIYAPLASWGDTAVGEIRGSWDRPSRSAILGLVAAALGIVRNDDAGHAALDNSLGIAVRMLAGGQSLSDYHTTQNPEAGVMTKAKPATRRLAIAAGERLHRIDTTLSRRWLRQDALYLVGLWRKRDASRSFDELVAALRAPAFVLYAGRKANVLGFPLVPSVVSAESLAGAMRAIPQFPSEMSVLQPRDGWGVEIMHDPCDGFASGLPNPVQHSRRDATPNRTRWQFSDRVAFTGRLGPEGAAS